MPEPTTVASVWLVREYDYELQEVCYVAATPESAKAYVETIRNKPCGHDWHDDEYPIDDCVDRANRVADDLTIEEWRLDSEHAIADPPTEAPDA